MIYRLSARIDHFVLVCRYADAFEHVDKEGKVELSDQRTMSIQLESCLFAIVSNSTCCGCKKSTHRKKQMMKEE